MLEFNQETHTYIYDGLEVPSVSRILVSEGFVDIGWFTDEGRQRGSAVHLHIKNHCQKAHCMAINQSLLGYMDAWKNFESQFYWEADVIEQPFGCSQFAGTPDQIGKMNGTPAVLDIKTGKLNRAVGLQLAAYEILYDKPLKRFALQLNSGGAYRLKEFNDRMDRYIFKSAVAIHHWKRNNL